MRKVYELTDMELAKVWENNHKLQDLVLEDMFDNAAFWCREYLDCWKRGAIDYCIGWDRGTYFRILNEDLFLDGLEKAQKNFCFLADEYNKTIEYCRELVNRLDEIGYTLSIDNENRLTDRKNELLEELENACYKRFMLEYETCFDYDNQFNYFVEFYVDARMDETFYIDENYNLFEKVEFVRNYA